MLVEILNQKSAQFFLMYGTSQNANFRYATSFVIQDPALYLAGSDGTELLVVPAMEKMRAERESRVREIASLEDIGFKERLKETGDSKKALILTVIDLLKSHRARKVLVPEEFPAFLFSQLRGVFDVEVIENPFSGMRAVKRSDEIKKMSEVSRTLVEIFDFVVKNFRFKRCEDVRSRIEIMLFERGYLAENTIAASGTTSADPHFRGYGEIEDHLILDVFPKSRDHGYHSDFTRTIFVSRNEELEEMYRAVVDAQQKAISMIKDGVDAVDVHNTVKDCLQEHGYKTTSEEGFIHSTGHGVGLEVHELPRISDLSFELKKGMTVTIEPGLYYRRVGGVRVEDLVVVRKGGCKVLTEYPKFIKVSI
jgi:Xaa-Pro aminopeptidase